MVQMNLKESEDWKNDEGYNVMYLKSMERYFNDFIRTRGYIYLNQIYEALGLRWDPDKENILFKGNKKTSYYPHPGRLLLEYFHGSELLLIHDLDEES